MALGQQERSTGSERLLFRDALVPEGDLVKEFPFLDKWIKDSSHTRGYVQEKELLPTAEDMIEALGGLATVQRYLKGATDEELVLQACRLIPMTSLEISRFGQRVLDGERLPREAIYKRFDPQGQAPLRFLLPEVHRAIGLIVVDPKADPTLKSFYDIVYLEKAPRFGDKQYWTVGGRVGFLTITKK